MEIELRNAYRGEFMKPQIFKTHYWEVDGDSGTTIVPVDVCDADPKMDNAAQIKLMSSYYEGFEISNMERKNGWLYRLSAPGYMDATEYEAFPSYREALEHALDAVESD